MKDWESLIHGKKITVMGLGLLGRAVNDAKFLAQYGAQLIITDLKNDEELRSSLDILREFPNILYRLGGHEKSDFQSCDYVLKAAGVPLDSPFIAEARRNRIPVKMSASWFSELSEIPVVGVTGTRGKSTTTHMIHHMIKAAGMDVLLGGNVRGVSTLALLPEVRRESLALMELDSWQCRGFGDDDMSPSVSVFTTFFPDHLNYYKNDLELYFADKAHIFLHQKPDDTLVVSSQVLPHMKPFKDKIKSRVVVADLNVLPDRLELRVPGEHNRLNAACAMEAGRVLGIDDAVIVEALQNFEGVPGRLELVREIRGVKIYNDTTATTPEATLAALSSLPAGSIVLIMGGADKGLDMSKLLEEIPKNTKRVVLLAGSGTKRIEKDLMHAPIYDRLDLALQDAMNSAHEGDAVILSPAFASFGMFKNEFDRGDQFNALVKEL